MTLDEIATVLDEMAESPLIPEDVRRYLKPKNELSAADTLRHASAAARRLTDSVFWMHDMVTGQWSPHDECHLCLVDENGKRTCSTFCAGLRNEMAGDTLKELDLEFCSDSQRSQAAV